MERLKDEYLGEGVDFTRALTCRDSRHAFGHRFEVERPSKDWQWVAVCVVVAFVIVKFLASRLA